nr:hypothetical protein [Tanacetum cinerariifolium]
LHNAYNDQAGKRGFSIRTNNMLTGKWTPMNRKVSKFNSLVNETKAMSGENDGDLMTRIEILYRAREELDFKHKSARNFLKGKHKWNNPESKNARRNRHRVTNNEPELFGDDELPCPSGLNRIAKSQLFLKSTASSAGKRGFSIRTNNMLTGKWTPMNREVSKFNSLVNETKAMSGENDGDLMTRIEHERNWILSIRVLGTF